MLSRRAAGCGAKSVLKVGSKCGFEYIAQFATGGLDFLTAIAPQVTRPRHEFHLRLAEGRRQPTQAQS